VRSPFFWTGESNARWMSFVKQSFKEQS
jgi:hypothetical protein